LLAMDAPEMVHAALDRALAAEAVGEYDGRFVVPFAGALDGLNAREAALMARITAPMPLARALTSRIETAALERLVARGLIRIAGVTPSDAAHVLGLLSEWDAAAADKGLRLLARRRTGRGERFAPDAPTFARMIVDQVTTQTVDCLLEAAFAEDAGFADPPETLARHPLTQAALRQHTGVLAMTARLAVPVVGLGASAATYYPAVGERLHTRMILPAHAGVANAIGAVVGQISQRATGIVTSPAEGRYTAHLPSGLQHFPNPEAALDAMEAALTVEATRRARASGAQDLRLSTTRDINEATIEGRRMFIEATVTATAAGRPRIAHAAHKPLDAQAPHL
jgi:N-methylhydantoinase A/oxoprolinase/acetone carboxylase beta subunit